MESNRCLLNAPNFGKNLWENVLRIVNWEKEKSILNIRCPWYWKWKRSKQRNKYKTKMWSDSIENKLSIQFYYELSITIFTLK